MKIIVKAKPSAREEKVEKMENGSFMVSVKEPPKDDRANRAIIKALAKYFNISPSNIRLNIGFTSRKKIFEIIL